MTAAFALSGIAALQALGWPAPPVMWRLPQIALAPPLMLAGWIVLDAIYLHGRQLWRRRQ
jgi:hypothetical protein